MTINKTNMIIGLQGLHSIHRKSQIGLVCKFEKKIPESKFFRVLNYTLHKLIDSVRSH